MAKRRPTADFEDILDTVSPFESDRGSVLVAAAWVEDCMRMVIEAFVTKFDKAIARRDNESAMLEELLGDPFMLGNARNRIRFLRAFGLMGVKLQTAIERLSRLRNEFAHYAGPASLQDKEIQVYLNNLIDAGSELVAPGDRQMWDEGDHRCKYRMTVFFLIAHLYSITHLVKKELQVTHKKPRRRRKSRAKATRPKKAKRPNLRVRPRAR